MPAIESIERPQRWSVPFSAEMTDNDVDRLLKIEPFNQVDPQQFRGTLTLRGILKNDARLASYRQGDIVVRQGDWGNSAFFVVTGSVRASLEAAGDMPGEILGRRKIKRKGFLQILAQLWRNPSEPEVRNVRSYREDPRIGTRGSGQQTRVYLQDVSAVLDKHRTTTIQRGQFFGELSALGRTPRQATVFADQDSVLLEIRWQGLRDLMRRDEALRQHIDQVFRERALGWFLLNTPIFSHLGSEELNQLVEQAVFETYGQYDWAERYKPLARQGAAEGFQDEPLIAAEGDHPNGVIIIRSGLARLNRRYEHGHRTVGYLTPGQVFGYQEIVEGWRNQSPQPLRHTLRAIGNATVVVIPTPWIEKLLLEKTVPREPMRGTRQASVGDPSRLHPDFVEFLVQNRFVNGSATMLIDLDRCTRCDDCVRACAAAHDNNPRFVRSGPVHHNVMVANACLHCEDPVCMIECPTGAIHRDIDQGNVAINDRTCIGCSVCAGNCPYDAIRMVEVRHRNGDFIRDQQNHAPIVKATKCDLCADQWGGPACQRACPHDALVRMDMSDVDSLAAWSRH